MPVSPGSMTPSLSRSFQTRPLIELFIGISPNRLSIEREPGVVRSIPEIALGTVVIGVPVPPALPGMVWPLLVPVGWVGSVTV